MRQAAARFFPEGPVKVATLRNAVRKGLLRAVMLEGKLLVTEAAIEEWVERCRVVPNRRDSGSSPPSAGATPYGASETERIARAQAALNTMLKAPKNP